LTPFFYVLTNSVCPKDYTGVGHEDSHYDDRSRHQKPVQMCFGTSELNGFTTSMIEDDHQIEKAAGEHNCAHDDLCEVVKGSGVLLLFLGVQPDVSVRVPLFVLDDHQAKLSFVRSTGEIRRLHSLTRVTAR